MKRDRIGIVIFVLVVALVLAVASSIRAQNPVQQENAESTPSGGSFTITKTVIAGGGANAQNLSFITQTTAGQAIAGKLSTGGQFSLASGFWTPDDLMPTAATVTVGGRVTTGGGLGIRNALVSITFPSGETRSTVSGNLGYFRFADVEVGAIYMFSISIKRFRFSHPTLIVRVNHKRNDINFVSD